MGIDQRIKLLEARLKSEPQNSHRIEFELRILKQAKDYYDNRRKSWYSPVSQDNQQKSAETIFKGQWVDEAQTVP